MKYIIKRVLRARLPVPRSGRKDIHADLEETIAKRRRILPQWEELFLSGPPVIEKGIHTQLAETIEEYKRVKQHWGNRLFAPGQKTGTVIVKRKAA